MDKIYVDPGLLCLSSKPGTGRIGYANKEGARMDLACRIFNISVNALKISDEHMAYKEYEQAKGYQSVGRQFLVAYGYIMHNKGFRHCFVPGWHMNTYKDLISP